MNSPNSNDSGDEKLPPTSEVENTHRPIGVQIAPELPCSNTNQVKRDETRFENLSPGTKSDPPLNPEAESEVLGSSPGPTHVGGSSLSATVSGGVLAEETGRERLKRHRVEVAGRVWIPEIWGQEELLKDWIDCTAFDASIVNNAIMSARAALVGEGRRANSSRLRIENRC